MKPLKLFIFLLLLSKAGRAQSPAVIRQYIDTYKGIAIEEMKRTGVPAAITLAQGIHETGAGLSVLVKKSNNHFGIKCKTGWLGESVYHDDDERGECFRKYTDPADSYKDHSDFLKTRSHYAFLFTLDPMDYEGWAWGLKKAGYATNPKYPQILIKLIDQYQLQDYTLIALGRKEAPAEMWVSNTTEASTLIESNSTGATAAAPPMAYPQGVFKINETEVVYVTKGTPYLVVAEQHRISLARLFEFNDLSPAEVAPTDGLLFLHRKRKRGANETYTTTGRETLQQIAQAEGLRLENLLQYNFLKAGMQPAPGSVLYLQKEAPSMPKLAVPQNTQPVFTAMTNTGHSSEAPFIVHTVQPKETVYAIAKRYAVTTDAILKWNGLETPSLKTGQQLRISKKEAHGGD
jgi:LysM repeat protein